MGRQLDLFDDEPAQAPKPTTMATSSIHEEPSSAAQLVIFPLVHHRSLLQRLAGRLRSIRDPGERDQFFEDRLQALYRSRIADGLSRAEARADVEAFASALRTEYRHPAPLPARYAQSRVILLFPPNRAVDEPDADNSQKRKNSR